MTQIMYGNKLRTLTPEQAAIYNAGLTPINPEAERIKNINEEEQRRILLAAPTRYQLKIMRALIKIALTKPSTAIESLTMEEQATYQAFIEMWEDIDAICTAAEALRDGEETDVKDDSHWPGL